MTPDTENFEQLRRLLALKRHEQPPPGYFNSFSSEVISRLKHGEYRQSVVEGILDEAPWLQRLWALLEGRPAVVGAFGAAVCGLLVAGILRSERTVIASPGPVTAANFAAFPTPAIEPPVSPSGMQPVVMIASSTNPVAPSGGSLFDQTQPPSTQPVNYSFILPGGQ